MKIALLDFICENMWPHHCNKKNSSMSNKNNKKLLNVMKTAK